MPLSVFRSWPAADRIAALGLAEYEDSLCSGCGQPMHLTMDPDNERRWVAELPIRCHACTALDRRATEYRETTTPSALRYPVHLKPPRRQRQDLAAETDGSVDAMS